MINGVDRLSSCPPAAIFVLTLSSGGFTVWMGHPVFDRKLTMSLIFQSLEKSKSDNPAVNCSIFGKKRRFPIGSGQDKYLAKHNAFFDQLDLVTYEEVCFL